MKLRNILSSNSWHKTSPIKCSIAVAVFAIPIFTFVVFRNFHEFVFVQYDDSYITYRYAQNLVHGNGLRFNPQDQTNSASSFLFVLLLGFLNVITRLPIEIVSSIVNVSSLLVLVASVVFLIFRSSRSSMSWLASIAVAYSIVSYGPLVYWTVSGMETTFFMAVLMLSIVLALEFLKNPKSKWPPSFLLVLSLLAITRVEGVVAGVFIGGICGVACLRQQRHGKVVTNFIPVLVPIGAFALQLFFYRVYYGSAISDPIHFKEIVRYYVRNPEMAWNTLASFLLGSARPFFFGTLTSLTLTVAHGIKKRKFGLVLPLLLSLFMALSAFILRSPRSDEQRYELILIVPMLVSIALLIEKAVSLNFRSWQQRVFSITVCVCGIYSVSFGVNESRLISTRTSTYMYVQQARIDGGRWLEQNSPAGSTVVSADIGALSFFNPGNRYLDAAGLVNRNQLKTVLKKEDVFRAVKRQTPSYLADTIGADGVSAVESILSNPLGYYVADSGAWTSCPQLPIFSKRVQIAIPKEPSSALQIQIARITWDQC